jgi:hypothetical protein
MDNGSSRDIRYALYPVFVVVLAIVLFVLFRWPGPYCGRIFSEPGSSYVMCPY